MPSLPLDALIFVSILAGLSLSFVVGILWTCEWRLIKRIFRAIRGLADPVTRRVKLLRDRKKKIKKMQLRTRHEVNQDDLNDFQVQLLNAEGIYHWELKDQTIVQGSFEFSKCQCGATFQDQSHMGSSYIRKIETHVDVEIGKDQKKRDQSKAIGQRFQQSLEAPKPAEQEFAWMNLDKEKQKDVA